MFWQENMMLNYIKANDNAMISELADFAAKIIKEHYDPIIGAAQNDYMINMFQTAASITKQIEEGYKYYFVCDSNGNRLGFLAYCFKDNYVYLSKFYLHKRERGKGYSKDMLQFIVKKAEEKGVKSIVLNVNKKNYNSIVAYEKLGFVRIREKKTDIGGGYYMDDYIYMYSWG